MATKRELLEQFVDEIENGWQIVQPDPSNPDDQEAVCIFQKGDKEVRITLAHRFFEDQEYARIKRLIGIAIRQKPI